MADTFVPAVHSVTGAHRTVPAHWLEESGPFPGQWHPATDESEPAPVPAPTPKRSRTSRGESASGDTNNTSEED